MQVGNIFAPIHWTDQFAYKGVVSAVIAPNVDAFSGQPESKSTPVAISMVNTSDHAILTLHKDLSEQFRQLLAEKIQSEEILYWCKSPIGVQNLYECFFVATAELFDWEPVVRMFQDQHNDMHEIRFVDEMNADQRIALIHQEQVKLLVYSHQDQKKLPSKMWLNQTVEKSFAGSPYALILGDNAATTSVVCSCFQVTEKSIQSAIKKGCSSTEQLGKQLKCGTNCGSCVPELKKLIEQSEHT